MGNMWCSPSSLEDTINSDTKTPDGDVIKCLVCHILDICRDMIRFRLKILLFDFFNQA